MAGNFELMGVQALVDGMPRFEKDMGKISELAQGVNKDIQKWATAQLQGMSAGAKAADELAKKYEKLAEQQRTMATYWTAKGKFDVAQQHIKEANALGTLAAKYREVADAQGQVAEKQSKLSALSDMVQTKWAQLAAAGGVLVAGLRGVQQFFEMGAEGAAITQTAKSFERLMKQLGAAPDILDRMREATGGTISDLELMSSTMTVMAGGSEELNRAMVASIPRILEIAKASNALNPTFGTTAFLFDSLMRGIKRTSPLMIDNAGVVLKVGQVTEAYAASLGKAADQLTTEERTMALLNGVLEQGQRMIDQVGGSTESAVDPISRFDAAAKNISDTFKTALAPAAANVADGMVALLTAGKKVDDLLSKHEKEVRATAKTYTAYHDEMVRAATAGGKLVFTSIAQRDAYIREKGGLVELNETMVIYDELSFRALQRGLEVGPVYEDVGKAFVNAGLAGQQAAPSLAPFVTAMAAVRDRGLETAAAYDKANSGLAKTVQTMMDNIAWVEGGGVALQTSAQLVKDAWEKGLIDPEEAKIALQDIGLAALQLQSDIGQITPNEAATQAAQLLDTSYSNAAAALSDVKTRIAEIPGEIRTQIKVAVTWYLAGQGKGNIPQYQHGGQFEVQGQGGPDSQMVRFMATPGEVVTVTPPQAWRGSTMTDNRVGVAGNVNINSGMSAQAFDQAMRNWLGA
jgi:hypothetical protein